MKLKFEFADAPLQLRKAIQGRCVFEPLPVVHSGIPGKVRPGRDVAGNTAFRRHHRAIADGEVTGRANLTGEDAAFTHLGRTGEPDLPAEHGICADARSVADEDQVVNFGAVANAGFADRCAIHAGIRLHFNVVLENCRPGLRHFEPGAILQTREAKPVAADNDAVLQDHAIANAA